ncbi:hypothetical protein KIPB_011779, partial [Kipferlia bialata]|eukprot:g11779.t1
MGVRAQQSRRVRIYTWSPPTPLSVVPHCQCSDTVPPPCVLVCQGRAGQKNATAQSGSFVSTANTELNDISESLKAEVASLEADFRRTGDSAEQTRTREMLVLKEARDTVVCDLQAE